MKHQVLLLYLSVIFLSCNNDCLAQQAQDALTTYINSPDSSYSWQTKKITKTAGGSFYEIGLVSQTWQNISWEHELMVYMPGKTRQPNTLLLVLRHIYNRDADLASLKIISDSTNIASAILYGIPNQPLFEGREEDDLQAYTFSEYIKSGDKSWPLLFPMVKSVVRAMDAIRDITKKESKVVVTNFILSGHSKRGHTSWLTAAVDVRVKGIIPVAIDVLNAVAQLPHHLEVFGEYSTPSKAATDFLQELTLPRGKELIRMIDAYSYRDRLTLPKLVVSASNDPFFTTDALNLYWNGLKGPKWILYLSNASHVSAYSDQRVNATAFAFVRAIAADKMLPQFTWEYSHTKTSAFLKITTDTSAKQARVWMSTSKSKDFRQATWTSTPMHENDGSVSLSKTNNERGKEYNIEIHKPMQGFMTVFGEIEFVQDNCTFLLSTQTNLITSD